MVVDTFHVSRPLRGPDKAQAKLIVHTYRVLTDAIADQRFKSVSWRASKVLKCRGRLKHLKFALENGHHCGESTAGLALNNRLSIRTVEGQDCHDLKLAPVRCTSSVQNYPLSWIDDAEEGEVLS